MKRPVAVAAVVTLLSARGCTCDLRSRDTSTTDCGALGQRCCPLGCLDDGCNLDFFGPSLTCSSGVCVAAPIEASARDAAPEVDAACVSIVACEQCDVSAYAPPLMGTPLAVPNACTSTELQSFAAACFSSTASTAACDAWKQQDAGACGACLAAVAPTDATWGPLVCTSSGCDSNVGGCIDLVLGTVSSEQSQGGAGSCGDAYTAEDGCLNEACGGCDANDFSTCVQSATASECASYAAPTTSSTGPCSALVADAAPVDARCFPQSDADAVSFLGVFCGTGP